jgi:hypothetical protein
MVTSRHILVVKSVCLPTWMSASTAYVIGSASLIFSSHPAIASRGQISPHSRICDMTKAGMNWTASNPLRANALTSRPIAQFGDEPVQVVAPLHPPTNRGTALPDNRA